MQKRFDHEQIIFTLHQDGKTTYRVIHSMMRDEIIEQISSCDGSYPVQNILVCEQAVLLARSILASCNASSNETENENLEIMRIALMEICSGNWMNPEKLIEIAQKALDNCG